MPVPHEQSMPAPQKPVCGEGALCHLAAYCAIRNVVHGCESRSRRTSFSQSKSGWLFRCSADLKSIPHECPIAAVNDMCGAIVPSVALFYTSPAGPYSACQGCDPRG